MRGQRALFDGMFSTGAAKTASQRPRNVLMPERNKLLLYRFYFHAQVNRLRYDDCLAQLEREFFIMSVRIVAILIKNDAQLRQIIEARPERAELEKMYPHINWKYNPR
ncbi:MAG: hypothetical protein RML37_12030 [Chitinophagales bacterium]|nr:hypothetical protein [Chitinophagales bacterium]